MIPEAGEFFGRRRTWNSFSKKGNTRLVTSYVLRSIAISSQPGWFDEAKKEKKKPDGSRLWKLKGWTDVRKRHGARSLAARNSTERLVAITIWSRED